MSLTTDYESTIKTKAKGILETGLSLFLTGSAPNEKIKPVFGGGGREAETEAWFDSTESNST